MATGLQPFTQYNVIEMNASGEDFAMDLDTMVPYVLGVVLIKGRDAGSILPKFNKELKKFFDSTLVTNEY